MKHVQTVPLKEVGNIPSAEIKPGIPAFGEKSFQYRRGEEDLFSVKFKEPVLIEVASQPEKWGFFQFPLIYRGQDKNTLISKWSMAPDNIKSYGKGGHGFAISRDGGKNWTKTDYEPLGGGLLLPSGDRISIHTPSALNISKLKMPPVIHTAKENYGRTLAYYPVKDLPEELRGVYLKRLKKGESDWVIEKSVLEDPAAVRYADADLFPVVWWGDMHMAADGSIIAGIYPDFNLNKEGKVAPSGVGFYRSTDEGLTWRLQGRIPYVPELEKDPLGNKRLALGFTEPGFEILADGTFICVMRTTDGLGTTPMYISRSSDMGKTWTPAKVFTNSGVLPRLLNLENGVTVLASGRPGVQIRFSTDSKAENWSDPFEMLPFSNEKDPVSCGYTELLATGPDTFLVIYSDFKHEIADKELRKAIKVREIKVSPKKK